MHRRAWGVVCAVLVAVAALLFLLGVTNAPGGLLGAGSRLDALQQTIVLTVIASLCGCAAIVAALVAIGRRG